MNILIRSVGASVATLSALGAPASADLRDGPTLMTELRPGRGADGALFGDAVAMLVTGDQDIAVVGAWGEDSVGPASGATYVYMRSGSDWVLQNRLSSPDGAAFDRFGAAVGVLPGVVFVSAPNNDVLGNNAGAVYVFREGARGWEFSQRLEQSAPWRPDAQFGEVMLAAGDQLFVGAQTDSLTGFDAGSVTVYQDFGKGFEIVQVLTPPGDVDDGQLFGVSIASSLDVLVIGAIGDSQGAPFTGAAYVYRRVEGVWEFEAKVVSPEPQPSANFGSHVSVEGDSLVVSSPLQDGPGQNDLDIGAAWTFQYNGDFWNFEQKFESPAPVFTGSFGAGLLHAGRLYIAERGFNNFEGGVRFYDRGFSGWMLAGEFASPDPETLEFFGSPMVGSGGMILIGAPDSNAEGFDSGTAYLFNAFGLPPAPCEGDTNGDNVVNFTDLNEVLSAFGQSGDPGFTGADLNGDGVVDFADLNAVLSAFGQSCD